MASLPKLWCLLLLLASAVAGASSAQAQVVDHVEGGVEGSALSLRKTLTDKKTPQQHQPKKKDPKSSKGKGKQPSKKPDSKKKPKGKKPDSKKKPKGKKPDSKKKPKGKKPDSKKKPKGKKPDSKKKPKGKKPDSKKKPKKKGGKKKDNGDVKRSPSPSPAECGESFGDPCCTSGTKGDFDYCAPGLYCDPLLGTCDILPDFPPPPPEGPEVCGGLLELCCEDFLTGSKFCNATDEEGSPLYCEEGFGTFAVCLLDLDDTPPAPPTPPGPGEDCGQSEGDACCVEPAFSFSYCPPVDLVCSIVTNKCEVDPGSVGTPPPLECGPVAAAGDPCCDDPELGKVCGTLYDDIICNALTDECEEVMISATKVEPVVLSATSAAAAAARRSRGP